jgi:hypothetical protein
MPKMFRRYQPKYRRKSRSIKRKTYPKQKFRFSKGLSRSIVPFTRETETYFRLHDLTGNTTAPFDALVHTNDGGVAGNLMIQLSDLPSHTEFTNLFRSYKLNYMKLTFYPSANTINAGDVRDAGGNYSNNQILIRTSLNRTGVAMGAGNTIAEWSQLQAKRQWMLAQDKPTTITMKLSQLSARASDAGTAYAVVPPRYTSTNNPSLNHLGLNLRFDSLDGTEIENEDRIWPEFRVVCKVYFTCKGVA